MATRPVRLGGGWAAPSVYPLGSDRGRLPPLGSPRGAGGESPCRGIFYPLFLLYVFVYLYMYTFRIPHPRSAQAVAFSRSVRVALRAGRRRRPLPLRALLPRASASFSLAPCGTAAGAAAPLRGFAAGGHSALQYGWNAGWRAGSPRTLTKSPLLITYSSYGRKAGMGVTPPIRTTWGA